jgi:hypothetical protein
MNRLSAISIVLLLIIITSIAAAQSEPRTVPPNDNLVDALPLPIGAAIKIRDIGAATSEVGESMACGYTAYHSVWFTFTPEVTTTLYLSTSGTELIANNSDHATVLGVYAGSELGSLMFEACGDVHVAYTSLWHTFSAGTTYAIQLGAAYDLTYDPKAFLKLKTRVTAMDFSPANEGFENPLMPDDWTLNSSPGDQIVCNDPAYPSLLGYCACKFEGSPGHSSRLTQTINGSSNFQLPKGGVVVFLAYFRGMDAANIGSAKLTAKVVYADGTPASVLTINLTGKESADAYQVAVASAFLKPGPLSKVKIKITHQSDSGVLLLDYIRILYSADVIRNGSSGVLPVPPPTGF